MYQCIKQYGSIKIGSFWDVDRYIVNSDGERTKVILTNEENWLLLSMTEFENHFAQARKPMTKEEWLRNLSFDELARVLYCMIINGERIRPDLAYIKRWLKEKHDG